VLQVKRILVAQTGFIGDVVLTTPLLQALKARLKPEFLAVLSTPEGAELLRDSGLVDVVITFDKRAKDKGWRGFARLGRSLQGHGFTHALAPHKSLRTGVLLAICRIPHRTGFRESPARLFYHSTVSPNRSLHAAGRILSLASALGIEPTGQERLVLRSQEKAGGASKILGEIGCDGQTPLFGIQPGSIWKTKRWVATGYGKVAKEIRERYGGRALILGGEKDKPIAAGILEHAGKEVIDLVGKTSLSDLMGILRRLKVLITNDSGPMHMAVALGVPVVAVFCSTTRDLGFYPYTNRAVVVEKNLSCRPCGPHGGQRCPVGTEECMRGIRPDEVLRAVDLLLKCPEGNGTEGPPEPLVLSV
jgi:heptosyltransferase-2